MIDYTFDQDLIIAEHFGAKAIKDTIRTCFKQFKSHPEAFAYFSVALNERIWYWFNRGNKVIAEFYNDEWQKTVDYADSHYTGDDYRIWFEITD